MLELRLTNLFLFKSEKIRSSLLKYRSMPTLILLAKRSMKSSQRARFAYCPKNIWGSVCMLSSCSRVRGKLARKTLLKHSKAYKYLGICLTFRTNCRIIRIEGCFRFHSQSHVYQSLHQGSQNLRTSHYSKNIFILPIERKWLAVCFQSVWI